jgi:hypothetical protein
MSLNSLLLLANVLARVLHCAYQKVSKLTEREISSDEDLNNPDLPAQEPLFLDAPTKAEKEASRKLLGFLKDQDALVV